MKELEDLQEKIFFECKNIIDTLSSVHTVEDILAKRGLADELLERISFLRVMEKNEDYFKHLLKVKPASIHISPESDHEEIHSSEEIEEEVLFTNELNEYKDSEEYVEDKNSLNTENLIDTIDDKQEEPEVQKEIPEVSNDIENEEKWEEAETNFSEEQPIVLESAEELEVSSFPSSEIETNENEVVAEQIEIQPTAENMRGKISEIDKEPLAATEPNNLHSDEDFGETMSKASEERKFKLAHIKGLKAIESLFDEDVLGELEKEVPKEKTVVEVKGSLEKANMPIDFMQAEKGRPEFRLDLNDKIAFTQKLFNGSQVELNESIRVLNSFKKLEDAKEYLSDLYYEKHWEKVDDYAQRLWLLVENKFL